MTKRTLVVVAITLIVGGLMVPAAADPKAAVAEVEGLVQKVTLHRDADGIPHIFAKNSRDLYFMQGYVHAQDRLFQMDVFRRTASGTLAELLGPAALPSDVELRTLGLRRAAERSRDIAAPEALADLEAYAEGVNAYVAASPALPPEYAALELTTFEPWEAVDSLVIAKLFAFSLSFDLDIGNTQRFGEYVAAGAVGRFDGAALFAEDLFRSAPFDPASTVPDATMAYAAEEGEYRALAPGRATAPLRPETLDLAGDYLERARRVPTLARALERADRPEGSNEWAVAGTHTTTGRPIMANDPHLALDTPATFYQVHLRAPSEGIDVIGSSFAGTPYVVLGQNQNIAWGATSNPMDVTDTYEEEIVADPSSPSGLATVYLGTPEPIIPIPVTFRANQLDGTLDNLVTIPPGAGIPPAVLIVPRRNNGPLIAIDAGAGVGLSVQYTGFSGTRELEAFRTWNRAEDLDDFRMGLQYFDVASQNWAYVDVDGRIAYFTSAEMPLREDLEAGFVAGFPPWFIRDGSGGNEWLPLSRPQAGQAVPYEILPPDEMPQLVDPPAGYFVNANNDPAGTTLDNDPLNQIRSTGGIFYLNPGYAIGTRAGRITQALGERLAAGPVSPDDMADLQADVVLLDAQVLTPYLLEAFANATSSADPTLAALGSEPGVAEAVARLAAWDFSTPTGIPEGYDAADTPGTVGSDPSPAEIEASVAATIYSVWRGRLIANTIDATLDGVGLSGRGPGSGEAMKAVRNLLDNFDLNQGVGASGLDFFAVPGVDDPADRRDVVLLRSLSDALDLLAGPEFAPAFGGSTDQNDYRWGRLHRVVFDHPLGPPFDVPPAGGAFPPPLAGLAGVPTDGGFGVVDASSHSARADGWNEFTFGSGPVRRYVGGPSSGNRITGRSSLPGGESGVLGSPWYANLLPEWLTNEAHDHLQRVSDVVRDSVSKEEFRPAR